MRSVRENNGHEEAIALRQELIRAHREFRAWRSRLLKMSARQAHAESLVHADAICAHAVCAEDATLHVVLKGTQPLFASPNHQMAVLQRRVGSAEFSEYMGDVFAAAEAYLDGLGPESLAQAVDLSAIGLGNPSVSWVINHFMVLELARACNQTLVQHRARAQPHP